MIAVAAGLIRSGSIALWQIMREISVSYGDGKSPPLGTNFPHYADKWAKSPKMYITKLHIWHESLADYPENDKAIAVLQIRDIRDVFVSLHYFRGDPDWETTFNTRGYKNYTNEYYRWIEKFPERNIILTRYEDLISNRQGTIKRISDFMGIPLTDEEVRIIDKKWSIEANKKRAEEVHDWTSPDYMAQRHIRSGKSRQWEEELSSEYISRIEATYGEWLVKNGYSLTEENQEK